MTTDIKALTRKRGSTKASLTIFKKYLNSIIEKSEFNIREILELRERMSRCETYYAEFLQIQSSIEATCEDDVIQHQYEEREAVEQEYIQMIVSAKQILSEHSSKDTRSCRLEVNENTTHNIRVPQIQLPVIQLPKFSGNYETWIEFRDTFTSLVHENQSINNVQKLHYLKSSIEGSAAQVIRTLEISNDNYLIAWNLLCERYENKKLLINNHIRSLFNINTIKHCTAVELRRLFDEHSKHLLALESLGQPIKQWDALLIYMISSKLDDRTKREWEVSRLNEELPTINDIKLFLKGRCELLESLEQQNNKKSAQYSNRSFKNNIPSNSSFIVTKGDKQIKCTFCNDSNHFIYFCPDFLKLNTHERTAKVKELKLCINCLKRNHFSTECKASKCKKCHKIHNTLLHYEGKRENTTANKAEDAAGSSITSNISANCGVTDTNHVILSTAIVKVQDKYGNFQVGRALLDSGSEGSFITRDFCNKLGLTTQEINTRVMGINQNASSIKQKTELTLHSLQYPYKCNVSCFVMNTITQNIPHITYDRKYFSIPENIKLADKYFYKSDKIDILLGANIFWNLICNERFQINKDQPVIQKTLLGWVLAGNFTYNNTNSNMITCNFAKNIDIQQQLKEFWEIEEYSKGKPLTKDERACEQHFSDHTYKDNGRYVVSIPFKDSQLQFGDTLQMASSRFQNLEGKFARNIEFKDSYIRFMREYEQLGHMTRIVDPLEQLSNSYYLPHHGVLKQGSITTKLRVVFDGSAKSTNGLSLNDVQYNGPVIQQDLFNILIRFRCRKYIISADIEKMYRQILVNPNQRNYQRIVWREDPKHPLSHYTLNTVTYGTTSAPYLAIRALHQVAYDNVHRFPFTSNVILNDFYVDDLLTGTDTIDEGINLCNELKLVLEESGFILRQWMSNSKEINTILKASEDATILHLNEKCNKKTLGLIWDSNADLLKYDISDINTKPDNTKREMLSAISKIFDPLGLLSPYIITAKIMLQELWLRKIGWDDQLPDDLYSNWNQFKISLHQVNKLQIPRFAAISNFIKIELHAFSDASEKAYGTCLYLRLTSVNGVTAKLLCAKSRVAPVKRLTIPRLELCGALLAVRMVEKVRASLTTTINNIYYWCDSTITLNWIRMSSANLNIFVANRVSEIQESSDGSEWLYINTKDNPADLVSRGIYPNKLSESIWWNGPAWLKLSKTQWPIQQFNEKFDNLPDIKTKSVVSNVITKDEVFPFNYTTSLTKLKRVTAWCLRFINNCKTAKRIKNNTLTIVELDAAMKRLVQLSQRHSFKNELNILTNENNIPKGNLIKLSPFLDQDGLIRVGGRLKNSNFQFNKKHPLLISNKHILSKLLVEYEHKRLLHAGPQQTLASIRENYWLVGGRNLTKTIIHKCITCFKANPTSTTQIMGNLPKHRLERVYPFYSTGIDYAGPFLIKTKPGRGSKTVKCYLCIFICFATKAIHLEPVSDLTTQSFIATLRRFVARRGIPTHIYSDNGKNFVGAKSELRDLGKFLIHQSQSLAIAASIDNITWHFIPSYSPHQGGLWEAGVKSVKHHIKRVVKGTLITFENFLTILCQIETILNSRPLYPLSSSPNDFDPITPSHFLIGRKATSVPDPDVTTHPVNRLDTFQQLQRMTQRFWKTWSTHYMSELQQRTKWTQKQKNITIGSLVLLKDIGISPLQWKLGRIVAVHPGSDGLSRVVSVKTTNSVTKRAVTKICPLPINIDNIDNVNQN